MHIKKILPLIMAAVLCLTGCANDKALMETKVAIPEYEPRQYETVGVTKGTLVSEINLMLKAYNYRRVSYKPIYDEMKVNKIYVDIGEHVKKGQTLISFESEDLEKRIKSYKDSLAEHELMLEHYTNLAALNHDKEKQENFDLDIRQINESIEVDRLYIEELEARLNSYNIIAEDDGIVFDMADGMDITTVGTDNVLISIVYGNDKFTVETDEDFGFNAGEHYTAEYNASDYELILEEMEDKSEENGGKPKWKLTFSAAPGTDFGYIEDMVITITKEPIKDAYYIPKDCIRELDDRKYVYVMENGFKTVRFVTTGDTVGGNTIILDGLTEEDRVVVP